MSKIYDSDYSVRLATLGAMGGDTTKCYDSVYEIDLAILDIIEHGGSGAVIDDNVISTETAWSSSKIVSELADAGFDVQVVQELPTTGEAHTLYFVPSADPQTQNVYDEYLYANNAWEQVGSTAVDMSDYYTADEVDAILDDYATITYVDASLANYATKNDVSVFITDEALEGYATESFVNSSLANYATTNDISTFVTSNDISIYATIADVDSSLNLKADKTYVDASLANKANISYVDTNFAKLSVLTQAQYNALATKDASTLYIISDAQ